MSLFKNKVLLITGGTGSFGNAVLKRFLDSDIKEVRIFSRDEKKQDDMRHRLQNKKVKFYIGDVRDKRSVDGVMNGVDYIFHAAALKQVPSCEFFPVQAVRTNVLGTENVLDSAIEHGVKNVVVLSTDKACYPINAMGISKAMRLLEGRPALGEHLGQDDAVDLVIYAFQHGHNGDLFVQKAPAATLDTLARSLKELYQMDTPVRVIGTRHGEKLYESLVTREEMAKAEDMGNYYRIPCDARDLNYDKYFVEGQEKVSKFEDYHSHNTHRLDVDGMKQLLLKLDMIKEDVCLK